MQTTLIVISNSQMMLTVCKETETITVQSPACHLCVADTWRYTMLQFQQGLFLN